mgnify:CR=1 FL=1
MKLERKDNTPKRSDWEMNNQKIREAFIVILKRKQGRKPTIEELAKEANLSAIAVRGHLKKLKFESQGSMWKVLTEDVIIAVYKSAMKGNTASQKLWFQLIEGWTEKNEIEHSGHISTDQEPPVIIKIG